MKETFDSALSLVLELEGGDKVVTDSGGLTKWGISQRAYPDLDIRSLTRAQAAEIYRQDYWNAVKSDELPPLLDAYVFDAAVNQGASAAIRMLQEQVGVTVDGVIGPKTLARVRALEHSMPDLPERYLARRAKRYITTAHFDRYGYGWFVRLFRLAHAL